MQSCNSCALAAWYFGLQSFLWCAKMVRVETHPALINQPSGMQACSLFGTICFFICQFMQIEWINQLINMTISQPEPHQESNSSGHIFEVNVNSIFEQLEFFLLAALFVVPPQEYHISTPFHHEEKDVRFCFLRKTAKETTRCQT